MGTESHAFDPTTGQLYPVPVPSDICDALDLDFMIELPILGIPNYDFVEELMKQLRALLAPLIPFFRVLDAIVQLFRCIKAVPDSIINLDPTALFTCLGDLGKKIAKLLELLPWVQVPILIIRCIDLLIAILQVIVSRLEYQLDKLRALLAAIDRAADLDDGPLMGLLTCEHRNMQSQLDEDAEILRGIGQVIGVLNLLMEIAGLPKECRIPSFAGGFDAASEATVQQGIDAVNDFIQALRTVRSMVPLP